MLNACANTNQTPPQQIPAADHASVHASQSQRGLARHRLCALPVNPSYIQFMQGGTAPDNPCQPAHQAATNDAACERPILKAVAPQNNLANRRTTNRRGHECIGGVLTERRWPCTHTSDGSNTQHWATTGPRTLQVTVTVSGRAHADEAAVWHLHRIAELRTRI